MKTKQELMDIRAAIMREMTQLVIQQNDLDLRLKHLDRQLSRIEEAINAIKE